ncbi:MAG TPA: fluoride efflux transporter CrcB [Firmicutes bacterium]|nr:fluoride efflux transporter CrcB [Bacillota bacterium]
MDYILCGLIALGGAIGAVGRFFLSTWISSKDAFIFPWGTFVVNVLGCFILGFIYIVGTEKMLIGPQARTFLAVGMIGAFTTFSTFGLETINLISSGNIRIALFNIFGSVALGLLAVWLGIVFAKLILG